MLENLLRRFVNLSYRIHDVRRIQMEKGIIIIVIFLKT